MQREKIDLEMYVKVFITILSFFIIVTGLFWGFFSLGAKYHIWSERQHGMAELARAEGNREIAVCEARAAEESAECYARAEIIRAKGVAEANKIIGDSLKGNEAYLRYRWIEGLQTNQMSVVYIPTEAGLPILEANRWNEERAR